MIEKWKVFLVMFGVGTAASQIDAGPPKNTIKFMDQGNLYDHRIKQERLRRLIVKQGDVISRTARYKNSYLDSMEEIQKDLKTLLEWKSSYDPSQIKKEFDEKLARQESRISKLIKSKRRTRKRNRQVRHRSRKNLTPSRRRRNAEAYNYRTARSLPSPDLELQLRQQGAQIEALQSEVRRLANLENENKNLQVQVNDLQNDLDDSKDDIERVRLETLLLHQQNVDINASIADVADHIPVLEQDDQTQNYTLKWELQIMQARLIDLEEKVNNTAMPETHIVNRMEALTDQVIENTIRNEMSSENTKKLKSVEQRVTSQHIQDINETVIDTNMILDQMKEFQDQELTKIDDKMWDNEENLLRLNATLDETVARIEDISYTVNGFSQSLDNFSKLYQTIRDDVEIFMVNSTANMRAFDTTVDLSIDLLDRMGTFNEEIVNRVTDLEDKYLGDAYESSIAFDDSSSDSSNSA